MNMLMTDIHKKVIDKIAVFDLDGTLYKCNSHVEILNIYRANWFYKSIFFKLLGLVFPRFILKKNTKDFYELAVFHAESFHPEFRESALNILKEKQKENYHVIILSNAPFELVKEAGRRLNIPAYSAKPGEKSKVIDKLRPFNKLFVCTDNKNDADILTIADECIVYASTRNRRYFTKHFPHAVIVKKIP